VLFGQSSFQLSLKKAHVAENHAYARHSRTPTIDRCTTSVVAIASSRHTATIIPQRGGRFGGRGVSIVLSTRRSSGRDPRARMRDRRELDNAERRRALLVRRAFVQRNFRFADLVPVAARGDVRTRGVALAVLLTRHEKAAPLKQASVSGLSVLDRCVLVMQAAPDRISVRKLACRATVVRFAQEIDRHVAHNASLISHHQKRERVTDHPARHGGMPPAPAAERCDADRRHCFAVPQPAQLARELVRACVAQLVEVRTRARRWRARPALSRRLTIRETRWRRWGLRNCFRRRWRCGRGARNALRFQERARLRRQKLSRPPLWACLASAFW